MRLKISIWDECNGQEIIDLFKDNKKTAPQPASGCGRIAAESVETFRRNDWKL